MIARLCFLFFFFSSRRRHTRCSRDWSSDVCSSDLAEHTGNERIDTHARSGPFDGQRFGEGGHSGLTGAVSRDFKESYQRRKRADVDDAPIAPLDHVATKDPAGAKGSFEVGLKEDRKSTRLNSSHGYI